MSFVHGSVSCMSRVLADSPKLTPAEMNSKGARRSSVVPIGQVFSVMRVYVRNNLQEVASRNREIHSALRRGSEILVFVI